MDPLVENDHTRTRGVGDSDVICAATNSSSMSRAEFSSALYRAFSESRETNRWFALSGIDFPAVIENLILQGCLRLKMTASADSIHRPVNMTCAVTATASVAPR